MRTNAQLQAYSSKMKGLVQVFRLLEEQRLQLLVDSFNKVVIYEPACELNNKYDAQNCARAIEEVKPDGVLAAFARKCAFDTFDQMGEFVFQSVDVVGALGKPNQASTLRRCRPESSEVHDTESLVEALTKKAWEGESALRESEKASFAEAMVHDSAREFFSKKINVF